MDNQAADCLKAYQFKLFDKVLIKVGINAGKKLDVISVFDLGGIEVADAKFGGAVFYARDEYALI